MGKVSFLLLFGRAFIEEERITLVLCEIMNEECGAKTRFGLIIQGPLYSGGIKGSSWGRGQSRVTDGDLTLYDTTKSLLPLISTASKIFDYVVIVTWANEEACELRLPSFENVRVEFIEDPGALRTLKKRKRRKNLPTYHQDNSYRQFYSTLHGVQALENQGVKYCAKIRTDQSLDVQLLRVEIEEFISKSKPILIPYFLKDTPWAISDFYFSGSTPYMKNLCALMLSEIKFSDSVHRDLFVKASLLHAPSIVLPNVPLMFTNSDKLSLEQWSIYRPLLDYFHSGSQELFESLCWRGSRIVDSVLYRERFDSLSFRSEEIGNLFQLKANKKSNINTWLIIKSFFPRSKGRAFVLLVLQTQHAYRLVTSEYKRTLREFYNKFISRL